MKTRFLIWLIVVFVVCGGCTLAPPSTKSIAPLTATVLYLTPTTTPTLFPSVTPTAIFTPVSKLAPTPTYTLVPTSTPIPTPTLTSVVTESYTLSAYEDITSWEAYPLPHIDGALLAPSGWVIVEAGEMRERLYSITFQPPFWDSPEACGYQCPVISAVVYSLETHNASTDETLRDWLARRTTPEPFGTDVDEAVMYFGVTAPTETTLGVQPALGFYHEAMGIRIYTVVAARGDVVIAFSKTHVDQFEFEPIYELMRTHARF